MSSQRQPNAIYLSNEQPRPAAQHTTTRMAAAVPPSQRPTTRIVAAPPPERTVSTRIVRREEFRGVDPRGDGDRLRARWLTALLGATLPLVAQGIVFRGNLAALWSSLATEAGSPLALWQQAGIAAGVALAMLGVLALIAALLGRSDGRTLLGGAGAMAALSLAFGLARVAGFAPNGGGIVAALDEAAAAPFAVAMLDDRARLRRDEAEHGDAAKRADAAEAALAVERAARADETAAAKTALAAAAAKAQVAADERDAAQRDAGAARDDLAAARADAERSAAALAAAESARTALAAERDQAVAAAAANAKAVIDARRELARVTARADTVQASTGPVAPTAATPAPAAAPHVEQTVAPRSGTTTAAARSATPRPTR